LITEMILATPETRATTVKTEITELRLKMWRTQANSVYKIIICVYTFEVIVRYSIPTGLWTGMMVLNPYKYHLFHNIHIFLSVQLPT